ncbi:hypothetical protein ACWC2M_39160, partial [Streptomyces sp. NPDC001761]
HPQGIIQAEPAGTGAAWAAARRVAPSAGDRPRRGPGAGSPGARSAGFTAGGWPGGDGSRREAVGGLAGQRPSVSGRATRAGARW